MPKSSALLGYKARLNLRLSYVNTSHKGCKELLAQVSYSFWCLLHVTCSRTACLYKSYLKTGMSKLLKMVGAMSQRLFHKNAVSTGKFI